MGKLYEVLAAEPDKEGISKKVQAEAINTFSKRQEHFRGHTKILKMFDDKRAQEEAAAGEHTELTTTVDKKLDYVDKAVTSYLDVVLQKEVANQDARADLVVDGETISENLPATFLLGLETRLKAHRKVLDVIPTLAPGIRWEEDKSLGDGVFRNAHKIIKQKTAKSVKSKIVVEPTEHHPAQVQAWNEDINVGQFETESISGMISPAKKSQMLGRMDALIQGTKQARMRANAQEAGKQEIGQKLMDYIRG